MLILPPFIQESSQLLPFVISDTTLHKPAPSSSALPHHIRGHPSTHSPHSTTPSHISSRPSGIRQSGGSSSNDSDAGEPSVRSLRAVERTASPSLSLSFSLHSLLDPSHRAAMLDSVRGVVDEQRRQQAERMVEDGERRSFFERPFECLCSAGRR